MSPILSGNQATTARVQDIFNELKANPEFYNILSPVAGYSTFPALTVANEIMCRILAENMPWKWNRAIIPPFLTVSLQQDYVTNITNIGWLEDAWRIDINNSTSNANRAPKPIFSMETVRDQPQTAWQSVPFNINFVPNTTAFFGLWQPNTAYSCGYGVAQLPVSPIQQFIDVNDNILYIDSTQLGLNITSPGYAGTTIPLPAPNPYGVSGATQPAAPPNATPGSQVMDGTVTWSVADPNGYALRLSPLPALNGLCWYIVTQMQVAPPNLLTMQQNLSPIPTQMLYLFRQGCRAMLKQFNGSSNGNEAYAEWEQVLKEAVRAGDRQTEEFVMYPNSSIMGGYSQYMDPQNIGAAWPFGPQPFGN